MFVAMLFVEFGSLPSKSTLYNDLRNTSNVIPHDSVASQTLGVSFVSPAMILLKKKYQWCGMKPKVYSHCICQGVITNPRSLRIVVADVAANSPAHCGRCGVPLFMAKIATKRWCSLH